MQTYTRDRKLQVVFSETRKKNPPFPPERNDTRLELPQRSRSLLPKRTAALLLFGLALLLAGRPLTGAFAQKPQDTPTKDTPKKPEGEGIPIFVSPSTEAETPTLGLRYPALSPDGSKVAFSYQGDIWIAPRLGGRPSRLTSHPAYDYLPRWSPDGKQILFTSLRTGNSDAYVIPAKGGIAKRLTFHQAKDEGVDWSPDGTSVIIQSNRENVSSLYRVQLQGGMPSRLVGGYWNYASYGRLSPDGKGLLLTTGFESLFYWWRKGYKGPNNADILFYDLTTEQSRKIAPHETNDLWPMWGADGQTIYFVSERGGLANLWKSDLEGKTPTPVTTFKDGPIRWPDIAYDGSLVVYERHFGLWQTDLRTGESRALPIRLVTEASADHVTWQEVASVDEYDLSPDGKKLAFVLRGDVFVTDAKASLPSRRLTETPWREHQIAWHPKSLEITYVSDRSQGDGIYRYRLQKEGGETLWWKGEGRLRHLSWSPDGKRLLFLQGHDRLMLLDEGAKQPHLLTKAEFGGIFSEAPQWTSDSRWLLYTTWDKNRGDLWLHSLETKKAIRLTPTAAHDHFGRLTPDGRYLLFTSNRYGSDWFTRVGDDDLFLLDLQDVGPTFKEDELDKLFEEKPSPAPQAKASASKPSILSNVRPPAPRPTSQPTTTSKLQGLSSASKKAEAPEKAPSKPLIKVAEADLEHRIRPLTSLKGNEGVPLPSPKGDRVLFFSDTLGSYQIWIANFSKGVLSGSKVLAPGLIFSDLWSDHSLRWASDGKAAYVLSKGKVVKIEIPSGKTSVLPLKAKIRIERQSDFMQTFREIWVTMRDVFYDPSMSGQAWTAIYDRYKAAVAQLQTRDDWRDLMNEMLGELNASHLGVRDVPTAPSYTTGALGADLAPTVEGIKIEKILPRGPLALIRPRLTEGLYLVSINGQAINAQSNPYRLLQDTVGKRLKIGLNDKPEDAGAKVVSVRPITFGEEMNLRYHRWTSQRNTLVAAQGKGRIGYLHMRSMGRGDLLKFIRDFETDLADKDAGIIDLRYNWGGNIHDRVLEILRRAKYAVWQVRGMKPWSQPSYAAAHKPLVMLINEETLSDGEMTANGFQALRLGTLIGTPTYRWLIFTTAASLMNGAFFRLPFWACLTVDGKDLEKVGVTPDILVSETFDDRAKDNDPQLQEALRFLEKKLQPPKASPRPKASSRP